MSVLGSQVTYQTRIARSTSSRRGRVTTGCWPTHMLLSTRFQDMKCGLSESGSPFRALTTALSHITTVHGILRPPVRMVSFLPSSGAQYTDPHLKEVKHTLQRLSPSHTLGNPSAKNETGDERPAALRGRDCVCAFGYLTISHHFTLCCVLIRTSGNTKQSGDTHHRADGIHISIPIQAHPFSCHLQYRGRN